MPLRRMLCRSAMPAMPVIAFRPVLVQTHPPDPSHSISPLGGMRDSRQSSAHSCASVRIARPALRRGLSHALSHPFTPVRDQLAGGVAHYHRPADYHEADKKERAEIWHLPGMDLHTILSLTHPSFAS